MAQQPILQKFEDLGVWKRGDERAPHKPLLVLYALGRWSQGNHADVSFSDVDRDLTELLKEFGPSRKSYHAEYPFWRLQNDGVWEVQAPADLRPRQGNTDPLKSELLAHNVRAGFTSDVKAALSADPGLVARIAAHLLEHHFPESYHSDILSAVGLSLDPVQHKRDPHFRLRVLTAYEWRCAVCGFDVRLGSVSVALDAAHIRWHQAGGPSQEDNGLALCVLHHKLFDHGAFTLNGEGVLLVSEQANGSTRFEEALLGHHGQQVRSPQRPEHRPATSFLAWHGREVFKGGARHLSA